MIEETSISSSLFTLPSWWVKAYDPFGFGDSAAHASVNLMPRLSDYELNVFAAVMSIIQRSLLTDPTARIKMGTGEIAARFSSTGLRDRGRDVTRTVEGILATRFMYGQSGGRQQSLTHLCESLAVEGGDDSPILSWEMSSEAQQLSIGMVEPYSDLIREAERQVSLSEGFNSQGPLTVWSAPWLDLTGAEQRFLLRLEKAMQWDFRWMHLDGIFGDRFDFLTAGLKSAGTAGAKTGGGHSSLVNTQKTMQRLVEHGLLQAMEEVDFLAMQADPHLGAQLIWQVSPTRMREFEDTTYRDMNASTVLWNIYRSQIGRIITALGMNAIGHERTSLERAVIGLVSEKLATDTGASEPIAVQGCAVIQQLPLFIEWVIRSMPGHPVPLPECVGELGISESLYVARRTFVSGFQEFQMRVRQMPETFERIIMQPGATLVRTGKLDTDRARWLALIKEALVTRPAFRSEAQEIAEPVRQEVVQPVVVEPAVVAPARQASVQGIRQTAAEELQKLRNTDPQEYELLKKRYLETLEPSRRKLLLDVQKRMTPETFEQHLRHSLIKYMIDHPTAWRTSSATKSAPMSQRRSAPGSGSGAIWGNVD